MQTNEDEYVMQQQQQQQSGIERKKALEAARKERQLEQERIMQRMRDRNYHLDLAITYEQNHPGYTASQELLKHQSSSWDGRGIGEGGES